MDQWSPRPAHDVPDGLVLFDGVCVLCSAWVRFVIERDPRARFRFLSIQSEAGRRLAERFGVSPDNPQTNVVIDDGQAWFKSDAALTVLGRLPSTRWTRVLKRIARQIRNPIYDVIARNRYRLFGRTEVCMIPSAEHRIRFLA